MFAGHEANANTILFAILLLACHPIIQKLLQRDIDSALDPAALGRQDWSYESVYPILAENMVGAVIHETLRLATVLPFLPKIVPKGSPQPIHIGKQTHVIPGETLILVNASAVHQHPKHWPQTPNNSASENITNPVASFNPQYWLGPRNTCAEASRQTTGFLRPHPGSFIPFSDGSRGCLGKKFALVELYALIVRIFSEYSVELAVEGCKPDTNKTEPKEAWLKARENAEYQLSEGVEFDVSLRFTGTVPITFVKRGEEKYADL